MNQKVHFNQTLENSDLRVDSAPAEWFLRGYLFCPGHGLERFTWINGGLKASVKTVSFLKKHLL